MAKRGNGVRVSATVVSAIYAIALAATGTHLPSIVARLLAYSPSAMGVGAVAFDLWIWKWLWVQSVVSRPLVEGTWVGTIASTWENPDPEGGSPGLIDASIVIEQTYWSLSISLMTSESVSHSTSASITSEGDSKAQHTLAYIYHNDPSQAYRYRSTPQNGATHLRIAGRRPSEMEGSYWTDRKTTGDLKFALVGRRTDFSSLDAVKKYALDQ